MALCLKGTISLQEPKVALISKIMRYSSETYSGVHAHATIL